jgi:radical SAM protein with 4Fe4S-binding SPASM domain
MGMDRITYEGIIKGADFQNVKDNIASLTKLKMEKSLQKPKIILTAGFLKSNIDNLINLPEICRELGIDEIDIGPFHGVDPLLPELCEIKRAICDIEKSASSKKVNLNIQRKQFKRNYRARECLWPWQGIYITVKGDIKPCCSRAYCTDASFGNIYKTNFNSIWHGRDYINFRKGLQGQGPVPLICRGCPWD